MNRYHENLTLWHYDIFLGDLECKEIDDSYPHYEFIPNSDFSDDSSNYTSMLKKILFTNNPIPEIVRNHFNRGFQISQNGNKRAMHMSLPIMFDDNKYKFYVNRNFATYNNGVLIEEFEFFYETKNCFSQWYKCEFEFGGTQFSSAEQFMMHEKALLFNDQNSAEMILETNNPREHKEIGRNVKGFDNSIWVKNSVDIVYEGNKQKFTQNQKLLNKLFKTKGKTLVESSPTDSIWGIGLSAESPKKIKRRKWKGDNLLGIVLTELREELRGNTSYDEYGLGYFTGEEFKEKYEFYKY